MITLVLLCLLDYWGIVQLVGAHIIRLCSDQVVSTASYQVISGQIAGFRRGQEQNSARDIFWLRDAAQRKVLAQHHISLFYKLCNICMLAAAFFIKAIGLRSYI